MITALLLLALLPVTDVCSERLEAMNTVPDFHYGYVIGDVYHYATDEATKPIRRIKISEVK